MRLIILHDGFGNSWFSWFQQFRWFSCVKLFNYFKAKLEGQFKIDDAELALKGIQDQIDGLNGRIEAIDGEVETLTEDKEAQEE